MRHTESRQQSAYVRWFRLQYPEYSRLLFSVPNGVATSATQARIAKAEGMVAGVSDLILLCPSGDGRYHALCIECKTEKGRQSDSQKMWQKATEMVGNKYVVVRNFDDFLREITQYLKKF